MIQLFPAASRYHTNHGWLDSHFSFSFADYYDPDNMGFGPLRVLNDDIVAPREGFGMHPHRNMEIITFVLRGELEHRDNLGNREMMRPGIVQKMTAGRGIYHSEMNPSATEQVELLQLWVEPAELQLEPGYEMVTYSDEQIENCLHPVIANYHQPGNGHIHQDATLYLSSLQDNKRLQSSLQPNRRAFLFVIEGTLKINEQLIVTRRDSLRITNETAVTIQAIEAAKLLLIDLP